MRIRGALVSAAILACVLTVSASTARAQDGFQSGSFQGTKPPHLKCDHWHNGEDTNLPDLYDKVVLLEFFSAQDEAQGYYDRYMGEYKKLHDELGDDGLVIIMITPERSSAPRAKIDAWVKKHDLKFLVGIDAKGEPTGQAYKIKGVPTTYLIDVTGKVVWEGHGIIRTLEKWRPQILDKKILEVPVLPAREFPSSFGEIESFIKVRRWNQAIERIEKLLKGASDEDKAFGEKLLADIDSVAGPRLLAKIEKLEGQENYDRAKSMLDAMKKDWKGLATGEAAEEKLKAYKKDKKIKALLKASKYFNEAEDAERVEEWKKAGGLYMKAYKAAKDYDLGARAKARADAMIAKLTEGK